MGSKPVLKFMIKRSLWCRRLITTFYRHSLVRATVGALIGGLTGATVGALVGGLVMTNVTTVSIRVPFCSDIFYFGSIPSLADWSR